METDHKNMKDLLPELQVTINDIIHQLCICSFNKMRLQATGEGLPYELKVIEILFTETVTYPFYKQKFYFKSSQF